MTLGRGLAARGRVGWSLGSQRGGAAGNGLLNNLIAYWPGNEASGDALDLHTNALHLSDSNTVTSNPGLVYALARQYTAANSERHIRPIDDALLDCADEDMTVAAWVYLDSKGLDRGILSRYSGAPNRGYILDYYRSSDVYRWRMWDGTNLIGTVTATFAGVPPLATWTLVMAWHDSVSNLVGIQVNNTTANTAATSGAPANVTISFQVGYSAYWDGRIGPTMFWKSAGGGGGVLTAAQRTALYNGGAGLPYASFTL